MDCTLPQPRRVVGVMTGTSIDAMDAALVDLHDERPQLGAHLSRPLGALAHRLRDAAEQRPMSAGDFASLAWDLGLVHADVIAELLADHPPPDRIAVHGQTIVHQPPHSWQLVNPAPIAQRFQCPVAYDLRQADLACGGEGAPITPAADWVLFRHAARSRAIVNLGGFCNVSLLPRNDSADAENTVRGFDVCACNQVLDAIARQMFDAPYDADGGHAATGSVDAPASNALLEILRKQRDAKRSLGTGDEATQWISMSAKSIAGADLAASAVDAIARCIGETLRGEADEILLAGGGTRNLTLRKRITAMADSPVHLTDSANVPAEAREAMAIAILGSRRRGFALFFPQ